MMRKELKTLRIVITCLTLAALALSMASCGDNSLDVARKKGYVCIGYAVEAPYAFLDNKGMVTGESPEIARIVVEKLGIPLIKWRQTDFCSLIDELEAGRIDLIAAGMFITPSRRERAAFSLPTFRVREAMLVQKGNPLRLHSYQQAAGRRDVAIAVLAGSVEETMLRSQGMSGKRLRVVPDALTGLAALESGVVQGLALSSPSIGWMAMERSFKKVERAVPFFDPQTPSTGGDGLGAFVFRKHDRQLREAWDHVLSTYIGSSGHRSLVAGFGFGSDEIPTQSVISGKQ